MQPMRVVAMAGRVLREAFGVAGVFVEAAGVEEALGEGVDGAVEPGGEVAVGVEDGDLVGGDAEGRGRGRSA